MGWSARWLRPRIAVAAVGVACIGAAGCGGGSDDDSTAAKSPAGPAVESPGKYVRDYTAVVAAAKTKQDCTELKRMSDDAIVQFNCPPKRDVRESLGQFKLTDDARYGTGAIVDYTSGAAPKGASVVVNLTPEGEWKISRYGIVSGPTVGTSDEKTRAGFQAAVDGYLKGVRTRDCDIYDKYTVNTGDARNVVCKFDFPQTGDLAKAMRANPTAKPKYLGGNGVFGFFGLTTDKPAVQYLTISVVKTNSGPEPFQVLNSLPGPPPGGPAKIVEPEVVAG